MVSGCAKVVDPWKVADDSAVGFGDFDGLVGAAGIDNHDFVDDALQAIETLGEGFLFVLGDKGRRDSNPNSGFWRVRMLS